jgi:hypothetical protein
MGQLRRTQCEQMFSALPLELGHCSMKSALRICAISGISMTDYSVVSGRCLRPALPANSASVERHFGKWHELHPGLLETFAHRSRQLNCGRLVAMNA